MEPTKDWSVCTTWFSNGERSRSCRSKVSFTARFRTLDPFQHHWSIELANVASSIAAKLDH